MKQPIPLEHHRNKLLESLVSRSPNRQVLSFDNIPQSAAINY